MHAMKYANPLDTLRHMHGESTSAEDYSAIRCMLNIRIQWPTQSNRLSKTRAAGHVGANWLSAHFRNVCGRAIQF
jgi:hypothetical protein